MQTFNIKSCFPFKQIRDQQQEAVDFALESLINDDKKFVIVEAGTGVGKSAIGLTVAKYLLQNMNSPGDDYEAGSWFITTQKILQDQYMRDFKSKGMMSVKSSRNHTCSHNKQHNCKDGQMMLKSCDKKSPQWKTCVFECPYKQEKKSFLEASEGVTNFSYFLAETNFSGKVKPRNLLVIDEAHNIENELSKFIQVSISERFASSALKVKWPGRSSQFQVVKWIREEYYPVASIRLKHMEDMIEKIGIGSRLDELKKIATSYDMLSGHVEKLKIFLTGYDKENWVMEEVPGDGRMKRKYVFRPIDVSPWANKYLFRCGKKVLMMSATILNKDAFCDNLGIKREEASFISIPSPFPVDSRQIHFFPVGKMTAREIDTTLPKLASIIKEILKQHKNEKGIIHCHSYKIANYLKRNIRSKRLLAHNSDNRDVILAQHETSKSPTVLLSPSMSEGVDLRGDLSRFQILCKVPYPYLGDQIVKKRMNKRKSWYPLQTAKTIVQSVGRSVRSMEDQAVTYILDQDWERFYSRNKHFFPRDFKNSLKGM